MNLPPVPENEPTDDNNFDSSLPTTILLKFHSIDSSAGSKKGKRVTLLQSKYTNKAALNQILTNSLQDTGGVVVIQCESFRGKTGKYV